MTKVVVVTEDGKEVVFDEVIGHQVGYGACQVMLESGAQEVFNNFKTVSVVLTEEEEADFRKTQKEAKERAEAMMAQQEALIATEEAKEGAVGEPANDEAVDATH